MNAGSIESHGKSLMMCHLTQAYIKRMDRVWNLVGTGTLGIFHRENKSSEYLEVWAMLLD
jgi:hypothetical protein